MSNAGRVELEIKSISLFYQILLRQVRNCSSIELNPCGQVFCKLGVKHKKTKNELYLKQPKTAHLYTTGNPAEYKCAVLYFQYKIFNGIEDTPRTV